LIMYRCSLINYTQVNQVYKESEVVGLDVIYSTSTYNL
jgi:hypothetical protein